MGTHTLVPVLNCYLFYDRCILTGTPNTIRHRNCEIEICMFNVKSLYLLRICFGLYRVSESHEARAWRQKESGRGGSPKCDLYPWRQGKEGQIRDEVRRMDREDFQ